MGGYPTGRALKPKWAPRMLRGHHIMMFFSVHRHSAVIILGNIPGFRSFASCVGRIENRNGQFIPVSEGILATRVNCGKKSA